MRPIAIALLVLLALAAGLGGSGTTTAQVAGGPTHRFSGAPTDFLVDGSERTLNFLLIAQTPAGEVLATAVIDPTRQWFLDVPVPAGVGQVVFVMAEPNDPTDVRGTTAPLPLTPGGETQLAELRFTATRALVVGADEIATTLDVVGDAQTDAEGVFYEATTDDGSVTIRIRDLAPGSQRIDLRFTPIPPDQLGPFAAPDQELLGEAAGIPAAGEILLFDADTQAKIDATIEVILAPLNVPDVQFLLWLVETPGKGLTPVEFTAEPDGALAARFAFDLIFIILDMPAPETNLRPGLNAVVYTGPQMPADRAFPGGPGRGAGIQALWRFTGVGFEAFFPAFPDLVVPTYRLYDPLFVVATGNGALMQQGLLVSVRRTVVLSGGDNLVSYTGAGGSILNVVDAAVVARARAIWIWRDSIGAWRGFFPGQPAAIQGITNLALGDIVFINTSAAVGWDMR